jgi:hypothetical protein
VLNPWTDELLRWSAAGEPGAPWKLVTEEVQQAEVIALAATDDGALVVTRSLGGTNGIVTWPATPGVVTRYDDVGGATPIALPGADVRAVFALAGGDMMISFVHDTAIDFLGASLASPSGGSATAVARLGPMGELRWVRSVAVPEWPHAPKQVAVAAGGVALLYPTTLVALGPDGAERWREPQSTNLEQVAVGTDGAVTLGTHDGFGAPHITRFEASGARAWDAPLPGPFDVDPSGRTLLVDPAPPLRIIVLGP